MTVEAPLSLEEAVTAELFKAEVLAWARRIGVAPGADHIRPMRPKWGSCSTGGRLTFDAGLLRQSAAFRAEVIDHELLHLKVPNHSALFKALLRAHLRQRDDRQASREGVWLPESDRDQFGRLS